MRTTLATASALVLCGHTNGDTVIFFPDLRTVHSGDLVIDGMPVIDYDNGGSALEFVTTLDKLITLDFTPSSPAMGAS